MEDGNEEVSRGEPTNEDSPIRPEPVDASSKPQEIFSEPDIPDKYFYQYNIPPYSTFKESKDTAKMAKRTKLAHDHVTPDGHTPRASPVPSFPSTSKDKQVPPAAPYVPPPPSAT